MNDDLSGVSATLHKGFLSDFEARELLDCFMSSIPWESKSIKIFGREVLQPRLMSWHGDKGKSYKYSGTLFEPKPWTDELLEIKSEIEDKVGSEFNSVLLNLYRNGGDSMGAHSDDEPELGKSPTIASLSLGASRKFVFRSKIRKEKVDVQLDNGDLLVMFGLCQREWKHELPKTKRVSDPRINLTFRQIFI